MEFKIRLTKNMNLALAKVVIVRGIAYCNPNIQQNPVLNEIDYVICDDKGSVNYGKKYFRRDLEKFDSIHIEHSDSKYLTEIQF